MGKAPVSGRGFSLIYVFSLAKWVELICQLYVLLFDEVRPCGGLTRVFVGILAVLGNKQLQRQ
jgi:hypothetical protein